MSISNPARVTLHSDFFRGVVECQPGVFHISPTAGGLYDITTVDSLGSRTVIQIFAMLLYVDNAFEIFNWKFSSLFLQWALDPSLLSCFLWATWTRGRKNKRTSWPAKSSWWSMPQMFCLSELYMAMWTSWTLAQSLYCTICLGNMNPALLLPSLTWLTQVPVPHHADALDVVTWHNLILVFQTFTVYDVHVL